jgi:N-methylhydantoinase A/oxoprolinase/acetone carboxylase beta subunit
MTPRYARDCLRPGLSFEGPALVEQNDATTAVLPGFRATIDEALHIRLERS